MVNTSRTASTPTCTSSRRSTSTTRTTRRSRLRGSPGSDRGDLQGDDRQRRGPRSPRPSPRAARSSAGGGDILKPDIAAPGQDILAAVAPPGNHGRLFDIYSGTSMASPHITGLGALLTQLYPDWSPAAQVGAHDDGVQRHHDDPFDRGAGHVDPYKAERSGARLRQPASTTGSGSSTARISTDGTGIDASDLNRRRSRSASWPASRRSRRASPASALSPRRTRSRSRAWPGSRRPRP